MEKILNPFISTENNSCFGCSKNNIYGLEMEFFDNGDEIISFWEPKKIFAGFKNVVHGGIQSTIHDEIACWYIFTKLGTSGVTTKLNTTYRKSAFTDKGKLCVKAKLISVDKKFALIHTQILNPEGELCSEAEVQYMIFPESLAKKKFAYPGKEAFYEKK